MEANNIAAIREALILVQKKINYLIGSLTVPNSLVANRMEINGIINAALAKPPRQCDVGTAGEQYNRFGEFCMRHYKEGNVMKCGQCPFSEPTCKFAWAQMPYEEGGEK